MSKHSFICNACVHFNPETYAELDEEKCKCCNGYGNEWQPRNETLYNKDPKKFMEYLLLAVSEASINEEYLR